MPFAVILGEDEQAQGKVRIKELGLREGHPEKDGVLVQMSDLVEEVRGRLRRREEGMQAEAVDGITAEGAAGSLGKLTLSNEKPDGS